MAQRPNVLWIMSDQHNARCTGYAGHPDVRTPHLDRLAARGVNFPHAFCNNPICAPSRITLMTGQYCHTHRIFTNDNRWLREPNPNTLWAAFQRRGYQTALVGKSHAVQAWDHAHIEHRRYTDLVDADVDDPRTNHYFAYLEARGLADYYGEGNMKPGQGTDDGSRPAALPYEHSIERFTGRESLAFLQGRDPTRPFCLQMSFQRPHGPIRPAPEHFGMYDPAALTLPGNAHDYFENRFAGKPQFMQDALRDGCGYPLADPDPARLRRCLASYYALITEIDSEIGGVLDFLDQSGQLENTVVLYTADHGDFAGEHGLFHKNFGIYDSIHRVPFLLSWPGGPRGEERTEMVESVDWLPTVCGLCDVPVPAGVEGQDLVGEHPAKDAVFCEWDHCSAIRTADWRLVFYRGHEEGELYDLRQDPGETVNRWADPDVQGVRLALLERLLRFTLHYDRRGGPSAPAWSPTRLVQFGRVYWSDLHRVCTTPGQWPPAPAPDAEV